MMGPMSCRFLKPAHRRMTQIILQNNPFEGISFHANSDILLVFVAGVVIVYH